MKTNNWQKKILAFFLAIILGIGTTPVSAQNKNPIINLETSSIGESESLSQIGESQSEADENLPQAAQGDILFQFREKGSIEEDNLSVEIHLTGNVASVKMKTNTETEQEIKLIDDENTPADKDYQIRDNLLYSLGDEAEPVKVVPNVSLGYSVNIAEVESNKTLESDTNVSFDLPQAGEHTFGLYDSKNHLVADLLYDTRAEFPGEISINVVGGFQIVPNNLQVNVDYIVPVSEASQKLIVTIPPFYSLNGLPAAQAGVTYKNTTMDFNPAHYENVEYGNKLIEYSQSGVMLQLRQSVLEISLANNVSGKISFTLTISSSGTQKQNLSGAMAYFQQNPDKIPLLIVAEAKNSAGETFNSATIGGNSTLTDAAGAPVENTISFPDKDLTKTPTAYLRALAPYANISSINYPKLSAPHYPYSDAVRLFPYVDNAELNANETLVDIDGKKYISVPQTSYGFWNFANTFPTSLTSYTLKLPSINHLKPSSYIPAGPVYLEYSYKGERIRETEFVLQDFPIAKAFQPLSTISYKSISGSWSTSSSDAYYVQGKKNQQFKIDISNSAQSGYITSVAQASLPMVYKDVALKFNIPFEFKLKDIEYKTTAPFTGHPLLTQMKPYKAEYTTFGGGTGTIPVPEDSSKMIIPEEIGHVSSLVFYYDLWLYNIDNYFITSVDIGTKREDGAAIPNNLGVNIIASFNTTSETMVELYDTPNENSVRFVGIPKSMIVRLVAEEDGVRFGTFSNTSNVQNKGDFYTSLRAYNETSTKLSSGSSVTFSDGGSPWKFAFKSIANQSKDYDDVKIIIEANNENEAKALSKMGGMQTSLIMGTNVNQYEIFIKTNLFPEGKIVTSSTGKINHIPFELLDNEYVTYFEVRLGTIIGSSFSKGSATYDIGEKIYPASGYFTPIFRDDRYYFKGTDKQEVIREGEALNLSARIVTSSEAKYMDPTSADYFNSTSTATMFFIPYVDIKTRLYETTSPSWNYGNTFYQGNSFTFLLEPYMTYFLNGSTTSTSSYTEMNFPSYDHRIYLEVAAGFEITGIMGYAFVEKKPLPDTNTNLFVFEGSPTTIENRIYVYGYVRPDAPVSNNIKIFGNMGFDYQPFKDRYMQPASGENAYYYSEPYHKVEFTPNPFPSHWGALDSADTQMYINVNTNNTININRANLDKVTLNALVNGINQVANASFYDHQKEKLSAQGWLTNVSDSIMPSYRATFNLPRAGKKTQGSQINGNDTFFDNKYDLYLSEAISYPSSLENPVVVYFAGDGRVLNPASPSEWKEVEKIQITFDNFAAHENVGIELPLTTDYTKLGKETQILKAYVGATSSKKNVAEGEFSPEIYTEPVTYNFSSYILTTRVGLDIKETGMLESLSNYVGMVKVYYEENGEEKLLYSSQLNSHNIALNKDATRIEVTPASAPYQLSLEKAAGIPDNKNSDFPRDTGSLPILLSDLINRTPYKHDAAFIYIPTLTANDIILREEETAVSTPKINISSTSPVEQYSKVFSVENATIATIGQDGTIVGLKSGETNYSYTVTNLLGDEFVITKKITVLKKVVPTAIFQKTLPDGAINADDRFAFNIWSKADKSDLVAIDLSVDSNSADLGGFFLPGTKYFVEEETYGSGYTPKELTITYTTSSGEVKETYPVAGAIATFTVDSDAEKMDMSFVNDSKRYSLKIEKMLLPLNGNHDFAQEFPVTVKDNVTNETVFDSALKGNGTQLVVNELITNRRYTITETKADYELILIEVVDPQGSSTGVTQPVRTGESSYVLTIDATHEGATVLVKNEPKDKGNLQIVHVPSLDFGQIINGSKEKLLRSEDVYLSVLDSRVVGGDWSLSVTASEMTTTLDGGKVHTLPYNGLRFSNETSTNVPIGPDDPVVMKEGTTKNGEPIHTENWLATNDNGITFQSENLYTYVGSYGLTLTWSLVSAP